MRWGEIAGQTRSRVVAVSLSVVAVLALLVAFVIGNAYGARVDRLVGPSDALGSPGSSARAFVPCQASNGASVWAACVPINVLACPTADSPALRWITVRVEASADIADSWWSPFGRFDPGGDCRDHALVAWSEGRPLLRMVTPSRSVLAMLRGADS